MGSIIITALIITAAATATTTTTTASAFTAAAAAAATASTASTATTASAREEKQAADQGQTMILTTARLPRTAHTAARNTARTTGAIHVIINQNIMFIHVC